MEFYQRGELESDWFALEAMCRNNLQPRTIVEIKIMNYCWINCNLHPILVFDVWRKLKSWNVTLLVKTVPRADLISWAVSVGREELFWDTGLTTNFIWAGIFSQLSKEFLENFLLNTFCRIIFRTSSNTNGDWATI